MKFLFTENGAFPETYVIKPARLTEEMMVDAACVPHKPTPTVYPTRRIFSCDICRKPTGWRDCSLGCEVPVCSPDCRYEMLKRQAEAENVLFVPPTDTPEMPPVVMGIASKPEVKTSREALDRASEAAGRAWANWAVSVKYHSNHGEEL